MIKLAGSASRTLWSVATPQATVNPQPPPTVLGPTCLFIDAYDAPPLLPPLIHEIKTSATLRGSSGSSPISTSCSVRQRDIAHNRDAKLPRHLFDVRHDALALRHDPWRRLLIIVVAQGDRYVLWIHHDNIRILYVLDRPVHQTLRRTVDAADVRVTLGLFILLLHVMFGHSLLFGKDVLLPEPIEDADGKQEGGDLNDQADAISQSTYTPASTPMPSATTCAMSSEGVVDQFSPH